MAQFGKKLLWVGDLFLGYDFGRVYIAGGVGLREASNTDFLLGSALDLDSPVTRTIQWFGGAVVRVFDSNGKIMLAYSGRQMSLNATDSKAETHQFSIGYSHSFHKLLSAHANYGYILNNEVAKAHMPARVPGGRGYQSVATLGVRLTF